MPKSQRCLAAARCAAAFSIVLCATPSHAQTVAVLWDALPSSSEVTSYRVCIGTSSYTCNIHLASVAASQTRFTFAPTGGMLHYVAITAINAVGNSPWSPEVTFSTPSFTRPPDQASQVGVPITPLQLAVNDPDGSSLNLQHTGLPPGLSLNSATRQITGSPQATGTYNVTVSASDGLMTVSQSWAWTVGSFTSSAPQGGSCRNASDFNGDCRGDLLWRNRSNGLNAVWYLNGATFLGDAGVPGVADQNWQMAASADVNRDGATDLIWRNRATGENIVWFMNGTTIVGAASFPTVGDLGWQVTASADINRDGWTDLIWRHRTTGDNLVWYLSGTTVLGGAYFTAVTDSGWQLAASADINQDGAPDLLWRHSSTGQNVIWYLSGTTIIGYGTLPTVSDTAWRLVAAFDTDNSGTAELIWRHGANVANVIWWVNQANVVGSASLPTVADLAWDVIGSR